MHLRCLFICWILRSKLHLSKNVRRLLLTSFPSVFPFNIPSQRFGMFRRSNLLLKDPYRWVGLGIRIVFILRHFYRSCPCFHAQFMTSLSFFLSTSNLFLRRQLSSQRRVLRTTNLLRLNSTLLQINARRIRGALFPEERQFQNRGIQVMFRRYFTFRFRAQEGNYLMRISRYTRMVINRPFPREGLLSWRGQA